MWNSMICRTNGWAFSSQSHLDVFSAIYDYVGSSLPLYMGVMRSWHLHMEAFVSAGVAIIVYINTLGSDFVYDDR